MVVRAQVIAGGCVLYIPLAPNWGPRTMQRRIRELRLAARS